MQLQRQVVRPSSRRWALALPALVALVVVGLATWSRVVLCRASVSKRQIAELVVDQYAAGAFGAWRADHPGRTCPASLDELSPYLDARDTRDPWGEPYRFVCAHGNLWVVSSGEDGRLGTDDDVRSGR